ncbi:MAG: fused MFS/spermidine synthase [Elusimicrobiota bacterium]
MSKFSWLSAKPKIPGPGPWFTETFTPHEFHSHRLERILIHKRTAFQEAALVQSRSFGRCLILDGETQSAALDEAFYHESLVHPAMLLHRNPGRVLILGGGEGATAREVLRHKGVRETTMVDIDGEILNFAKKYLDQWHQGAFDDPRLKLVVKDGRKVIEEERGLYDIILSDLPSPLPEGPAWRLYTVEFYRKLRKRLAPGGIFALQSSSGNLLQFSAHHAIVATLRRVFPVVRPYYVYIPSFDIPWGFALCSTQKSQDPLRWTATVVEHAIRRRIRGRLAFLDGESLIGLMRPPKYYLERLKKSKAVITDARPIFFMKDETAPESNKFHRRQTAP